MSKYLFVIFLFLFAASSASAQTFFYDDKYYDADVLWEAGISFGLMYGVADVGTRKGSPASPGFYDIKSLRLNESIYFGILYKNLVEGRLEITKGTIAGNDASSNTDFAKMRNLNYKSAIFDLSLIGAFHPLLLRNTETLPVVSPYIMAGVGFFSFDPKTLYNGQWIGLRAMNTEGQNSKAYPALKQYNLRALSLPVGLGIKYEYSAKYNIRLESLYYFTSSDYLDDASTIYVDRAIFPTELQKVLSHRYTELNPQLNLTGTPRANANNNDAFLTFNIKIGYVIGRQKIPLNYNPLK